MSKFRSIAARAASAAALMPLLWLAGCASGGAEIDDYYQPAMHYERFPIEVAKGSVKLDVDTRRASLSVRQEDAVVKFAQQALATNASHVVVQTPSSGRTSSSVAARVTELLILTGLPPESIVHREYRGGKGSPVTVTFQRKFAVTSECGDWSDDLAVTGANEPPANFGCATQHNIAAVVADPEDFEVPRTATGPDAMRRNQVFVDYRTPKSTTTPTSDSEAQTVSDVAQ